LAGALHRLRATSRALGQPITLSMAEEELSELISAATRVVRLADIQKAVCDEFGLQPDSLRSARKTKGVADPRTLAMWLSRKYTRLALSEIGEFFGRRSHSTVISAQKKVDGWLSGNARLQLADRTCHVEDAIRRIEEKLLAG
jgi:chromosomal replication initiator protein